MKKKITLLLFGLFLLCSIKSIAQHYYDQMPQNMKGNSNWILGDWGVNMNTTIPQVFHVPYFGLDTFVHEIHYGGPGVSDWAPWFWDGWTILLHTNVSDPQTGALIFNVKNHNCYNKNYQLMPHGYGAVEDWSVYVDQFANFYLLDPIHCVVPSINNPNRYYYFSAPQVDTYDAVASYPILRYSIVDMSLDGGLGDIDTLNKNKTLWLSDGTEVMGQILPIAGNNCDMWLLTFIYVRNSGHSKALIYHITEDGIDTIPLLFHLQERADNLFTAGYDSKFVVSPNRKTILYYLDGSLFSLRFNPENGALESGVSIVDLHTTGFTEDLVFTPDNRHFITTSSQETSHAKIINVYDFRNNQFSFVNTILNKGQQYRFPLFYIHMKAYGDRVYFNVLKDTTYPGSILYPYNLPDSSAFPAGALSSIQNVPAQSWSQFNLGPEIHLPFVCGSLFPNPVVHPYYPTDTIPDVYVDTLVCAKHPPDIEPFTMIAKPGFADYIWNDGTVGTTKTVDKAGRYWVYYRGQCNERVDSFIINANLNDPILPADTWVCEQRFPFDLKANDAEQYLWFNNNTTSQATIPEPGIYWIQYLKNGCIQHDSIQISSEYCPCHVSMPSGFTPNGDGLNDYFKPSIALGCVPTEYVLKIYNRWGQLVYSSFNDFDIGWDGQYKSGVADVGTYFYELKFKSRFLSEPYYKKGSFVLIK